MTEADRDDELLLNPKFSTTRAVFKTTAPLFLPTAESGGLKTQGFGKKSLDGFPLITVVTVVFNGETELEKTIESILGQSYKNVEYIIIDGASVDGTVNIIRRYQQSVDIWISEKDNGIYDAMNKAIDMASGEWINFMNAGDVFFNTTVLENIAPKLRQDRDVKIYYGDHTVNYGEFSVPKQAGDKSNLWKGSQFSHQSTFISTAFHKKNKYEVNNPITGDFAFFYKAWTSGAMLSNLEQMIATYSAGGLSDKQRFRSTASRFRVIRSLRKVGPKEYTFYAFTFLNLVVVTIAKKLLPPKWISAVQRNRC